MKNSFSVVFALLFSITLFAQPGTTKPVAKPTPKPGTKNVTKPVQPVLKNLDDSVGYCVGISVANFYRQMGSKKLNTIKSEVHFNKPFTKSTVLIHQSCYF